MAYTDWYNFFLHIVDTFRVLRVTSLSDIPRLQYYDVQTLEYRYISKLPMNNERIWSYVKWMKDKKAKKTTSTEYLIKFILITKKNRTICSS
jgi:hypothetical protein